MAYVVGSVSVEVVPDFKNAQIEITRFFERQADKVEVPVRPKVDDRAAREVEVEARKIGDSVGKAISDGAEARIRRAGPVEAFGRQIVKLEQDIQKAKLAEKDATDALRLAELRMEEARKAGNRSRSTLLAMEQSIERQQRKIADAQRAQVQAAEEIGRVRRQQQEAALRLVEEEARKVEAANRKALEAARKADEARERADQQAYLRREALREREARKAEQDAARAAQRETSDAIKAEEERARARAKIQADAAREQERAAKEASDERIRALKEEARETQRIAREQTKAYNRAVKDAEKIKIEVDKEHAERSAHQAASGITQAITRDIRQNGGIIAAAIGGALLFGAPIATAAATTVFAGFAAVAAAQSDEVRSAWLGMWEEIKRSSTEDGRIVSDAFVRSASQIRLSLRDLRPEIQSTFADLAPQIDTFTESLTQAAENAIPGIAQAVRNSTPAVLGFGDLLTRTGTGLSEFYEILSDNAGVGGEVFRDLGGTMSELLPLLGKLVVSGAEVATAVLPALNTGLGLLNTAADLLGGSLSSVVTGIGAFNLMKGAGRITRNYAGQLSLAANAAGNFDGAQARLAKGLGAVGQALPILGIGVGVIAAAMADGEQQSDEWTQAILEGGAAAKRAREEADTNDDLVVIAQWLNLADSLEDVEKNAEAYRESLDPLARAQLDVEAATADVALAMDDESGVAGGLDGALGRLNEATARQAEEQARLQTATEGVTQAMADQADQANGGIDAFFAYEKSLNKLEDAQKTYSDLWKEGKGNTEEASRALLDLQEALKNTAQLAGAKAMEGLPASMSDTQKKVIGAKASLDELNRLVEQGFTLPPSLETYRQQLENIVAGAEDSTLAQAQLIAALEQVGYAVEGIPGTKAVIIDAPTAPLLDKLDSLGFEIETLPDGEVRVIANSDEAMENLDELAALLAGLDTQTADPTVVVDPTQPKAAVEDIGGKIIALDGFEAAPKANLVYDQFLGGWKDATGKLVALNNDKANPKADLIYDRFSAGWRDATGKLVLLDNGSAVPTADLNDGPFQAGADKVDRGIGFLDSSSAFPLVGVTDHASPVIQSIASQMANLQSKTITITTVNRVLTQAGIVAPQRREGGPINDVPIQRFDGGGAVVGRGTSIDDLVPAINTSTGVGYRVSNGEHILDGRDVALLGGQAGVYALRDALNRGAFGSNGLDVRRLIAMAQSGGGGGSSSTVNGFVNHGTVQVVDINDLMRKQETAKRRAMVEAGLVG